jgi:RNA polymerase sigma factor (sigma-70 family)
MSAPLRMTAVNSFFPSGTLVGFTTPAPLRMRLPTVIASAAALAAALVAIAPATRQDVTLQRGRMGMPTTEELNGWAKAVADAGDRAAFSSLFEHFAPRVKAYLIRSGSAESAAEELTQEAMVLVWRKAAQFDSARAALSTWIFTIARNLRVDAHRKQGDVVMLGEPEEGFDIPDTAASLDEQVLAGQRERGVRAAMDKLPPEQARILKLSFYEEHPHAQIAQDLAIPLGTVKSRIRLAMNHLRRLLDGLES